MSVGVQRESQREQEREVERGVDVKGWGVSLNSNTRLVSARLVTQLSLYVDEETWGSEKIPSISLARLLSLQTSAQIVRLSRGEERGRDVRRKEILLVSLESLPSPSLSAETTSR